MNFKSISFYLSLFCFPISFLAFVNILYASYFDYFLSIETYFTTLGVSLLLGLSLLYYGKKGSKIIVPNLTIVSCLNAIIRNNHKPVFVDVDKDDFNICIKDLKNKWTLSLKK